MNLKMIKYGIIRRLFKNNPIILTKNKFNYYMGYKLNLKNPKSFNEKINWIKLKYYNPLYEKCSDKIEVREYVKSKGLENILTREYGYYNSLDEIKLDKIPKRCVIKTTHSSGGVYIVKDKNKINKEKLYQIIGESLKTNLYDENFEWQYKNLKPRIIIEELIETNEPELIDYKFFCFNGKVEYIYIAHGTTSGDPNYCIDFYDKEWNYIKVSREHHKNFGPIERPKQFEEMKKIAEQLSKDFAHVRVDLYSENNKIYFGELTFTTCSGFGKFKPIEFDYILGEKFDISNLV